MDNLPLLFAFLTSCFLSRQIQGAEIAAVPREPTCSLRTNTRGVPFLQPGAPTCLSAAPEALNFKPPSHSNFATYSPEDRLLRLQQAVDDLLKKLENQKAQPAASPQLQEPAVGNAHDILFAVRRIEFTAEPSFIELVSLTRRRDEAFSLALSSVLLVVCSREGLLEARSVSNPVSSVALKTAHAAPVLSLSVFPQGDGGEPLGDPKSEPVLRHLSYEPLILSLAQSDAFQVSPGGPRRHNCAIAATISGERLVLVGGRDGRLSGALKAQLQVTQEEGGIQQLVHMGSFTVFATKSCVGHINPTAPNLTGKVSCIGLESPIASVALDGRKAGRGAVSLCDGQILYFDIKTWTLLHKLPRLLTGPSKLIFAKEKLLASPVSSSFSAAAATAPHQRGVAVYNVGAVDRPDAVRGPAVYFLSMEKITSFALLRRTGDTSVLAFGDSEGQFVRIFECLHHDPPALSEESWSHLRLPIMILTIVVAVVAQLYRMRKAKRGRGELPLEETLSGGELQGLWNERLQAERRMLLQQLQQQQQLQEPGDICREPSRCAESEEVSMREQSALF